MGLRSINVEGGFIRVSNYSIHFQVWCGVSRGVRARYLPRCVLVAAAWRSPLVASTETHPLLTNHPQTQPIRLLWLLLVVVVVVVVKGIRLGVCRSSRSLRLLWFPMMTLTKKMLLLLLLLLLRSPLSMSPVYHNYMACSTE